VSRKERQKYTKEQRTDAIQLVRVSGQSIMQTSKDLGIPYNTLCRWVQQAKIDAGEGPKGAFTTEEKKEMSKLRKQLRIVTMERDFLKKVSSFFARENS